MNPLKFLKRKNVLATGRHHRGVALVITLAFVALLTGLMVAFFSRAMAERQVSNSSATSTKTSLFADGATDVLLSKLKQEIVLSSSVSTIVTGPITTTLYFPLSGSAAMMPQYSGTNVSGITSWAPNLLIRSGSGTANQYFFTGTAGNILSGAIAVSSTASSLNGRSVSLARWNKHCLLTGTGADMTPSTTGANAFVAPDWVLVTRSGSSPVSSTLTTSLKWSGTSPNTVIGRYAYAIYDEGGLLDVNAAGSPIGSGSSAVIPQVSYKPALAFADLTQIGLTPTQSDQLVAWRNWATTSVSGSSFLTPNFTGVTGTSYFNSVVGNGSGFLKATGSLLNNGQSDRMFCSRQDLIAFAQRGLGLSGTGLNVLNYLGTFNRDINQPSYAPPANRPLVLPTTAGGNNAYSYDNAINPSFLTARVLVSGTRNDGSAASVGEPVVKRRYALSRLAWLTCKGPSQPRATSGDPDIVALKKAGFTTEWLQQGTDENILKYFGLQWVSAGSGSVPGNYWQYVHGRNGTSGAILRLNSSSDPTDVARSGREADFFELLKATINVGSLAKIGSSVPKSGNNIPSRKNQYYYDLSVDNAIVQIGANIIDQFDSDSFPTRIQFNDGTNPPTMMCGIENLPYLYRIHPAVLKVQKPLIAADTSGTSLVYYNRGDTLYGNQSIQDTGLGATMLIPELWNPHDWCGLDPSPTQPQLDQTLGTMGPLDFELFAQSDIPVTVEPAGYYPPSNPGGNMNFYNGDGTVSPGYQSRGFSWSGNPNPISENNSKMTFQIPRDTLGTGAQMFREPTALFMPGKPSGSNLSAPGLASLGAPHSVVLSPNKTLLAQVGDGPPYNSGPPQFPGPPIVGNEYIGMYLGTVPLIWRTKTSTPAPAAGTVNVANTVILDDQLGPGVLFTFNLQCKDAFGTLITYDQKQVSIGHSCECWGRIARPMQDIGVHKNGVLTTLAGGGGGFLQSRRDGDRVYVVLDPRTSRFGFQNTGPEVTDSDPEALRWCFPPYSEDHLIADRQASLIPVDESWLSRTEGIMGSFRNGWGNGAAVQAMEDMQSWRGGMNPYNFPKAMGFYPGNNGSTHFGGWGAGAWTYNNSENAIRMGLFAENDAASMYNDNAAGDVQPYASNSTNSMPYTQAQYYSDADGVVRRGMGGWTDSRTSKIGPATLSVWDNPNMYSSVMGLPMRVAHQVSGGMLHKSDIKLNYPPSGGTASLLQSEARPIVLNRPFRSVAELGYTFSGTPWKNLNFEMPESGECALLDVFCLNDTDDARALVAGKVNLNTRNLPVLKAIINGAYKNEWPLVSGSSSSAAITSSTLADIQAKRLLARTTGVVPSGISISGGVGPATIAPRPLQNLGDLVGRWGSGKAPGPAPTATSGTVPYGPTSFDGFSADLINPAYFTDWVSGHNLTLNNDSSDDPNNPTANVLDKTITRRRGAPIRALANVGQTRVWNLLIDLVAQTGRYPQSATGLDKFMVEGEQHYWVHVAIDRFTGQVLDKQIEIVKE